MTRTGELRLFVSSTFRDLMPEREQLIKKVFPRLRAACRERGIEFTEIDLRWGITEEEASSGKLLRICVEEIDKCRPYIIGIVGSRYGFTPGADAIAQDPILFEEHPWLRDHVLSGKSITDVEFTHGMLNSHNTEHAFVYDQSNKKDIKEADRVSLSDLLSRVKQVGIPHRNFDSAEEFGEQVLSDMLGVIERDFPISDRDTELARARESHEAFALNRRHSYVTDRQYKTSFNEYINSDSKPLVIWGRSGLGKSSLLASLVSSYREENPNAFIIEHYVGAGASASDAADVIRHIMLEIKERYQLTDAIPSQTNQLREEFPLWLAKVQSEKLVLAIDALNQLTGLDGELHWLPDFIPANVRLIVSVIPGEWLDELTKREWQLLELMPLDESIRERITKEYLIRYRKVLSPEQLAAITKSERTSSPIFLRTLLEEIRIYGHFSHLTDRIEHYLAAEDESQLFHSVLLRMEEDHGKELVGKVMTSIWASRFGLSESELLEITSLTRLELSIFLKALDYHLMQRGGLYTFFHNYLREGVEARYLPNEETKVDAHRHLANYFSQNEYTIRRRDEEPWQWERAGRYEELHDAITAVPMFKMLSDPEKLFELVTYWRTLVDTYEPEDSYQKVFELQRNESINTLSFALSLATFFKTLSKYAASELFLKEGLSSVSSEELHFNELYIDSLIELGEIFYYEQKFDDLEDISRKTLQYIDDERESDRLRAVRIYQNLTGAAYAKQDGKAAMHWAQKSLEVAELLISDKQKIVGECLENIAAAYSVSDEIEKAIDATEKALSIKQMILGVGHPQVVALRMNLGRLYTLAKRYNDSEKLFHTGVQDLLHIYGEKHSLIARLYIYLSSLYMETNNYQNAVKFALQAAQINRSLLGDNHYITANSYLSYAKSLLMNGSDKEAVSVYMKYMPIREAHYGGKHPLTTDMKEFFSKVVNKTEFI